MTGHIEERLARLEALEAITRLKHLYWHYNDVGHLGDKIASLFTEDGIWSNAMFGHYEGRAAIRAFFNGASSGLPFCAHVGMNPIIDVTGDTAVAKWRALLFGTFVENGDKIARLILIDYLDTFARIDGQWYIRKLDILFNFNVPFGESWSGTEQIRAES
jgi:hypothetical protein